MAEPMTNGSTQLLPIPVSDDNHHRSQPVFDGSAHWEIAKVAMFGILLVAFWSFLLVQAMIWVSGS